MKDKTRGRRVTHGKNCRAKCRARSRRVRVPFQLDERPDVIGSIESAKVGAKFWDKWALPLYVLAGLVALAYLIWRQR